MASKSDAFFCVKNGVPIINQKNNLASIIKININIKFIFINTHAQQHATGKLLFRY